MNVKRFRNKLYICSDWYHYEAFKLKVYLKSVNFVTKYVKVGVVRYQKLNLMSRGEFIISTSKYNVRDLESIFNDLFNKIEQTELKSGGEEPMYLPSSGPNTLAQIISTHDYFSSVLHEVSHWCIAGSERRKLVDFGYWYEPDGRNEIKQREFELVEVKPQAIEWLFTEACGIKFRLSVDNLEQTTNEQEFKGASDWFKQAVLDQALHYLELENVPERALVFIEALLAHFRPRVRKLEKTAFSMAVLD